MPSKARVVITKESELPLHKTSNERFEQAIAAITSHNR